jgi:hypothetical protein
MPALAHLQPDHDETLIARLAADDLTDPEAATATRLVADCPACAQLHADLHSIIAATAQLPAPHRTRDFRLTDADAARLRRTGWRRLLGRFGDPRLAFTRPLATGLVTLGIAGLLLSAAPSFLPLLGSSSAATSAPAVAPGVGGLETPGTAAGGGQGAGAPVAGSDSGGTTGDGVNAAASAPPPVAAASAAASAAPASAGPGPVYGAVGSTEPTPRAVASTAADLGNGTVGIGAPSPGTPVLEQNPGVGKSTDAGAGPSNQMSPLLLASLVLVGLGIALFALRWIARRTA